MDRRTALKTAVSLLPVAASTNAFSEGPAKEIFLPRLAVVAWGWPAETAVVEMLELMSSRPAGIISKESRVAFVTRTIDELDSSWGAPLIFAYGGKEDLLEKTDYFPEGITDVLAIIGHRWLPNRFLLESAERLGNAVVTHGIRLHPVRLVHEKGPNRNTVDVTFKGLGRTGINVASRREIPYVLCAEISTQEGVSTEDVRRKKLGEACLAAFKKVAAFTLQGRM